MPMKGAVAALLVASLAVGSTAVWGFNTAFLRDTPVMYFSAKDWTLFTDTLNNALNDGADGATSAWENPSTGSRGEITPVDTREVNGMRCRNTRVVTSAQGLTARSDYLLCRAADGEWTFGGPQN